MTDAAGILPSAVVVVFPVAVSGVADGSWFPVEVDLKDHNASGLVGYGVKTFHDTVHALRPSAGVAPSNLAALQALALRAATDFWNHMTAANQDTVWPGVLPAAPDGLHDLEFTFHDEMASTRVTRTAWGWEPDELLHASGSLQPGEALTGPLVISGGVFAGGYNPPLCSAGFDGGPVMAVTRVGLGERSTDGLLLQNLTPAILTRQQWSPRVRWSGSGWRQFGGGSQAVDWIAENQPYAQAFKSTAGTDLVFSYQVACGGYQEVVRLCDALPSVADAPKVGARPGVVITSSGIGTAGVGGATGGLVLENPTRGAGQNSPAVELIGHDYVAATDSIQSAAWTIFIFVDSSAGSSGEGSLLFCRRSDNLSTAKTVVAFGWNGEIDASSYTYQAAVPGDWTGAPPTTVNEALDRVAAALNALGSPP